ncbi:MAG: hypothetical protein ACR2P4_07400 [Gammaproteobacteria bacterium]
MRHSRPSRHSRADGNPFIPSFPPFVIPAKVGISQTIAALAARHKSPAKGDLFIARGNAP